MARAASETPLRAKPRAPTGSFKNKVPFSGSRGPPLRLLPWLVLLVLALAPGAALAQDAGTTNATNTSSTNTTAPEGGATGGNATATDGNETAAGGNETAPDAPAAPQEITLKVVGYQEGSAFYFTVEGYEGRNPTLSLPAGAKVTVLLTSASGFHNIQVTGSPASPFVDESSGEITYTFTVPESGSITYWCVPHRGSGMQGTIRVQSAGGAPAEGEGDSDSITGETVDLGQFDPACAGTKIPAAVAQNVVGGPTVADYIAKCKAAGGGEVQEVDNSHPADLVIPGSFLLIALGIVGVVWVHKYYKP